MSYLVLARKYRPQTFSEITGQEHVTRTLTNAIEQDRVHHAFLFCGARGVGKTTAARVLAKALNCDQGPTPMPCGECKPCLEIAASGAIDVYEIDGASNRGINEIRELREGVAYAPQRDRYKIYIIDEVHMLTTEAFNALLKTLEEPPPHVKFIFATTEPHKIPITILSRCQRFDFKRIPLSVMVGRLQEILEAESITIDSPSLRLIARESEGSMRDALSLMDRIISFAGDSANFDQVTDILGVADRGWLRDLVEAALARDASKALGVVQDVFSYGTDIKQFTHDLVHYLRDIIMLRVAGRDTSLTDLSDEETRTLAGLGRNHQVADLQRLFAVITATAEKLAQASFPRLELEMAVIRMCELRPLVPVDALLQRLESLERHLESGAPLPPPAAPVPPAAPSAPPTSSTPPASSGAAGATTSSPREVAPAASPRASNDKPKAPAEPEPEPDPAPAPASVAPEPAPSPVPQPPAPAAETAPIARPVPPAPARAVAEPVAPPRPQPPASAPAPPQASSGEATDEPPQKRKGRRKSIDPEALKKLPPLRFSNDDWEVFVDSLVEENARLAAFLARGQVTGVSHRTVHVGFIRDAQSGNTATTFLPQIRKLLSQHVNGETIVQIDFVESVEDCPYERREARHRELLAQRKRAVENHPAIAEVVQRFNGTVRHVQAFDPREQHP